MFHSPLQIMQDLTIPPFEGSTSSLAHRPVSSFDTICNGPSPPLVNIVCFGSLRFAVSLMVLKHLLGRGFHTLIRNALFSSPTEVGSNNHPSWWPASSLRHCSMSSSDTICNDPSPRLVDTVCFGSLCIVVSLTVLKRLLGRGFHTLIRNVSFPSPNEAESNNPPWGTSVLLGTPPDV